MKTLIITLIVIILAALGIYFYPHFMPAAAPAPSSTGVEATSSDIGTTTAETKAVEPIGTSVGGNAIDAYHFGTGATEILFVGGIHGGYEWNTSLVAYDLISYLQQHPEAVPTNETITVIPVVNPDGLAKVVGTTTAFTAADVSASQATQVAGRFNAHGVDLNRNFDCDWQSTGTWQNKQVSGGSAAFSEPESMAMKQYIEGHTPAAVVVWYSAAGGVYASNCHSGVSSATQALTTLYADASGYPAHEQFDYYAVTGDMTNWLAKIGVPAISVLLTNHTDPEWNKNLAGVQAVIRHFAQ